MKGTLRATTPGIITPPPIVISQITWVGPGKLGDELVVLDDKGNDIVRLVANDVNYNLSLSFDETGFSVAGINVEAIPSGTLTIYYK
jgi:hypothetical protein